MGGENTNFGLVSGRSHSEIVRHSFEETRERDAISEDSPSKGDQVKTLCEFVLKKARNREAIAIACECKEKNYELTILNNIKRLELWGRKLTNLPEELILLENLTTLDLGTNFFTELPVWLEKIRNLKVITLNGNRFTEFPPVLLTCQKLHTIYLASNPGIKTLPVKAEKIISYPLPNHIRWV